MKLSLRLHGDETVLEARDHRQEEGREDLVVRAAGADHGAEDHAVQAAEMVVGNRNETTFLRNALQVCRWNLIPDAHFLKHMGRKFGTERVVELVMDAVDFLEFQQAINGRSNPTSQPPLDSQEVLQFVDFQDGRFGLRFGFRNAFFHHSNYQR